MTYTPGETVPIISFCTPFATPVKTPAMEPKMRYSFNFLFNSSLKNLSSSGSLESLLNDAAGMKSILDCKSADGLLDDSGGSDDDDDDDDCACPISDTSATTRASRVIGVCAMLASVKLTMERKRKIRATALCRRIIAGMRKRGKIRCRWLEQVKVDWTVQLSSKNAKMQK